MNRKLLVGLLTACALLAPAAPASADGSGPPYTGGDAYGYSSRARLDGEAQHDAVADRATGRLLTTAAAQVRTLPVSDGAVGAAGRAYAYATSQIRQNFTVGAGTHRFTSTFSDMQRSHELVVEGQRAPWPAPSADGYLYGRISMSVQYHPNCPDPYCAGSRWEEESIYLIDCWAGYCESGPDVRSLREWIDAPQPGLVSVIVTMSATADMEGRGRAEIMLTGLVRSIEHVALD